MIRPMNPALYRRPRSVPVLVLVDMQQEYEVAGRPLALPEIAPALENCRLALNHARESGIQVAYVRWIGAPLFQAGTRFARWIEGFEPHGCDMIFDRDRPSCFASPAFADVMERGCPPLVVAGFAGEAACLATAIDGYHRGQEVTFLADASTVESQPPRGTVPELDQFRTLFKALFAKGERYKDTGGIHAAALVDADSSTLIAHAEDIGRHNAVDKSLGAALLARRRVEGLGLLVTGRISAELAFKAARAGLAYVATPSVPSTLAVEIARRSGMVLVGRAVSGHPQHHGAA